MFDPKVQTPPGASEEARCDSKPTRVPSLLDFRVWLQRRCPSGGHCWKTSVYFVPGGSVPEHSKPNSSSKPFPHVPLNWVPVSGFSTQCQRAYLGENHGPCAEGCSVIMVCSTEELKSCCVSCCWASCPLPSPCSQLRHMHFGFVFKKQFCIVKKKRNLNLQKRSWTSNKLNYLICVQMFAFPAKSSYKKTQLMLS